MNESETYFCPRCKSETNTGAPCEECGFPAASGSALLVIPTDTRADCVAELRAAGFVPLMTDNPNGVRLISAENAIGTSDMIMAALKALTIEGAVNERHVFLKELHRRLLERELNAD